MRLPSLSMTLSAMLLFGACAQYALPTPPLRVVGDGEHGVIIGQHVLAVPFDSVACVRATEVEQWQSLRSQFGGGFTQLPEDYVDFGEQHVMAIRLPRGAVPIEIVVSSEEGVDVVTVDIELRDHADEMSLMACLFRMERRSCQTAVVIRDLLNGSERTIAVFSGL
jgi:hypothetical protein